MDSQPFTTIVEVLPPTGPDPGRVLRALEALASLPIDGFSVPTNPVARPRLNALAMSALVQQHTGRPAILTVTTRDHNRLSLQDLLWGAQALGVETVLVATGDYVALGERARTTTVRDVDVFELLRMARASGLHTGAVFDPHAESGRIDRAVRRLERKVDAGAQFAITQPLYDERSVSAIKDATRHLDLPVYVGIMPLYSARHAEFLYYHVAGITPPESVRERMRRAEDPVAEGVRGAREVLALVRQEFAGACLMPPFNHYALLFDILA